MRRALSLALLVGGLLSAAEGASIGKARVAKFAPTAFNQHTNAPTSAQMQWMRDHYVRMSVFSPYFDTRLSWFSNAWVYKDLYAIYPGSSVATAHPDWILHDAAGRALYIPYGCSGGTCPQYAGDVGNPAFRADWIANASAMLAKGYLGLLIDDVNMRIDRISDGNGTPVLPRDPRTGTTMTAADWLRYMAEFTEQIRATFPSKEIAHNDLWPNGTTDPFVVRQLLSANVHSLERGVNDAGIVHGTGKYGFETFLAFIEWAHQHGASVWLDATVGTDAGLEYALATHLLVNDGLDYIGNTPRAEPDDWWPGWDIDLGAPLGARTMNGTLFQRDFQNGRVLVNQPGSSQVTVQLGTSYLKVDGSIVTSATLAAAQGLVLRRVTTGSTSTTTSTTTTRPTTTSTTSRPSTTSTTTRPSTTTTIPPPTCPGPDADGDGIGNACDPCTNLAATGQDRAKLTLGRLTRVGASQLSFKGIITDIPLSPAIDPVAKGLRILVTDSAGGTPIDVTIAGGAFDGTSTVGWRTHGTTWLYRGPRDGGPSGEGIEKIVLRLDSTGRRLKFQVKGRNGIYPVDATHLPLVGTLVVDAPVATTGQCAELTFPATPPERGSCVSGGDGDSVRCK